MEDSQGKNGSIFARADEFLQAFKKGAEFTHELLQENEKLRFKIVQLEEESKSLTQAAGEGGVQKELIKKVSRLEEEKKELLDRYREVESENRNFAQRYVEIEEENNNLANLYIASFQLHSTLDFKEVLQIILEIIINLIGAEKFGILLLDEKLKELQAMATEGVEKEEIPPVRLGEGIIGKVLETGESYFVGQINAQEEVDLLRPIVCIPLKIKEHIIGVLVIYKLLQQKTKFVEVDYELFTLLAGHAATSIFSSKLYSDSERKLSTIQGFIDLLTK